MSYLDPSQLAIQIDHHIMITQISLHFNLKSKFWQVKVWQQDGAADGI